MADEIKLPKDEKPQVNMAYEEIPVPETKDILVDDSFGGIPNVSAAPTYSPRKMIDQMRIENSTLWIYDNEARAWFQLKTDSVYGGRVSSGSAGTPFPTGWSASNPSTGNYVVTHNLGHTSYAVTVTPDSAVLVPSITSRISNTFTVNFRNLSGVETSSNFFFILTDES